MLLVLNALANSVGSFLSPFLERFLEADTVRNERPKKFAQRAGGLHACSLEAYQVASGVLSQRVTSQRVAASRSERPVRRLRS